MCMAYACLHIGMKGQKDLRLRFVVRISWGSRAHCLWVCVLRTCMLLRSHPPTQGSRRLPNIWEVSAASSSEDADRGE